MTRTIALVNLTRIHVVCLFWRCIRQGRQEMITVFHNCKHKWCGNCTRSGRKTKCFAHVVDARLIRNQMHSTKAPCILVESAYLWMRAHCILASVRDAACPEKLGKGLHLETLWLTRTIVEASRAVFSEKCSALVFQASIGMFLGLGMSKALRLRSMEVCQPHCRILFFLQRCFIERNKTCALNHFANRFPPATTSLSPTGSTYCIRSKQDLCKGWKMRHFLQG